MAETVRILAKDSGTASSVRSTTEDRREHHKKVEDAISSCEKNGRKLRKFIFAKETKHILLGAMNEHEPHRTPHSKK